MRFFVCFLLLSPGILQAATWGDTSKNANKIWTEILSTYVRDNGGVDYVGIEEKGQVELKKYLDAFANIQPAPWDDSSKKALYINFYNAGMIYNVLRYAKENKIDLKSEKFTSLQIKDISVPGGNIWNGDYKFSLAGEMLNLDNIEHGLIRGHAEGKLKSFAVRKLDPRIHAAVNCAALSCPILRNKPYTPETLDAMLTENMTNWLNDDDQFSKVDSDTLKVNSIVIWYYEDFDGYAQKDLKLKGAGHYLAPYIKAETKDAAWKSDFLKENFSDRNATFLRISSDFDSVYNWKISDVRNR